MGWADPEYSERLLGVVEVYPLPGLRAIAVVRSGPSIVQCPNRDPNRPRVVDTRARKRITPHQERSL